MVSGTVPAILARQTAAGDWAGENNYYQPKYVSTHWSMQLLSELAADGNDERLQRGAAFMLSVAEKEIGLFLHGSEHGLSCFWGNLLRYALYTGFLDDQRLENIIDYLTLDAEDEWRCKYNDDLPCAWGCARALWGLAAVPERERFPHVQAAIRKGIGWLLEDHQLETAAYPTSGTVHPLWFRLNFPLFYQVDLLFVLRVLSELGALDHPGARAAVTWLQSKQSRNGRFRGASPYRTRTWRELGGREETDRWATLFATSILGSD